MIYKILIRHLLDEQKSSDVYLIQTGNAISSGQQLNTPPHVQIITAQLKAALDQ